MDVTQSETLADQICGCANREQHRRDVALLNEAFAAHRQAALLEGVRIGLEAAAKMADEWRDENRKNVSKSEHSNMSDMLEGAAIECNALAGEFRKFDPAAVLARQGGA